MNEMSRSVSTKEPLAGTAVNAAAEAAATSAPRTNVLRPLVRGVPTAIIVAALAGLAWWGHHSGWHMPSFAKLLGNTQAPKDDWCGEHAVPESLCVECNPSLMVRPKLYDFCEVHGVHQCPLDHPDVAQLSKQPIIMQADLDRAARALKFKAWPENNPTCNKLHRLLQFASEQVLDKMGVAVMPVLEKPMIESVLATGEYTFEQPRVTPLYTVVSGRVWQMTPLGEVGAVVKQGDIMAFIDAIEVGKAKAEFLQAFAQVHVRKVTYERLKNAQGVTSEASIRDAEAALREASIRFLAAQQTLANFGLPIPADDLKDLSPDQVASRMQFLGLGPETVQQLKAGATTGNLLPVRASQDGTVIDVKISRGEVVDSSKTLFVVADTSRMWLLLNVRQEDTKHLKLQDSKMDHAGNKVLFKPDGGGPVVTGELAWRSKVIDDKTRTLQYRANVVAPPSSLAAHTFGKAEIIVRAEPKAVVVPRESIHWEGDCHVVFVRDKNWFTPGSPKVFHIRTIRPGVTNGQDTEVIAGLLPGEIVASKNSTVLRAEMLKNSLGVG